MSYLFIIIITLVVGLAAQAGIKSTYAKWSKVPIANGIAGSQAARRMLDNNGLSNVAIEQISGQLSDNFDPKSQVLHLSGDVYGGASVAATAVACHESGHAVQHARGYMPARMRMAIVPIVNFASNTWVLFLLAGMLIGLTGLVYVGIFLFAFAVLFQLVTLPVEFDASHRAMDNIETLGLPADQVQGARKVLTAAAMTYVAAALASVLQLLYYIGMARR